MVRLEHDHVLHTIVCTHDMIEWYELSGIDAGELAIEIRFGIGQE
jgi:hypothetical protein